MASELQPLLDLAANENIAIKTLTTVLYLFGGAICVLFATLILVIKWALAVNKEAWGYVKQFSDAFKKFSEDVAYAIGKADGNGESQNQGRRRRSTD